MINQFECEKHNFEDSGRPECDPKRQSKSSIRQQITIKAELLNIVAGSEA
jgi:hypothetical protein